MNGYILPETAEINGKIYPIRTDFRLMIKLLSYLDDRSKPELFRWQVALQTFYKTPIPPEDSREAMDFLAGFLSGGRKNAGTGHRCFHWQMDAPAILAGVNQVAGQEVRSLPYLHWWTFLSYFHGIGEGQLSFLVGIREKLRRGEKLTKPEQEFYRANRAWVRMEPPDPEKERLQKLLG